MLMCVDLFGRFTSVVNSVVVIVFLFFYVFVNLCNSLNCTCIYVLYDSWLIPHPVVISLTYGSIECNLYVCMYVCTISTVINHHAMNIDATWRWVVKICLVASYPRIGPFVLPKMDGPQSCTDHGKKNFIFPYW
jgi:hypothetical protein